MHLTLNSCIQKHLFTGQTNSELPVWPFQGHLGQPVSSLAFSPGGAPAHFGVPAYFQLRPPLTLSLPRFLDICPWVPGL